MRAPPSPRQSRKAAHARRFGALIPLVAAVSGCRVERRPLDEAECQRLYGHLADLVDAMPIAGGRPCVVPTRRAALERERAALSARLRAEDASTICRTDARALGRVRSADLECTLRATSLEAWGRCTLADTPIAAVRSTIDGVAARATERCLAP